MTSVFEAIRAIQALAEDRPNMSKRLSAVRTAFIAPSLHIDAIGEEFVGLDDLYAESGDPEALMRKYGLTANEVMTAVRRVLARKSGKQ